MKKSIKSRIPENELPLDDDDSEIEESDESEGDDTFSEIDGLIQTGKSYFIYRQYPNNKLGFLDEVVGPYSIGQIKADYGGGTYLIRTKDKGRIERQRQFIIEGPPKILSNINQVENNNKPEINIPHNDNLTNIRDLLGLVREITETKQSAQNGSVEMMSKFSEGMMTLQSTMLDLNKNYAEAIKSIKTDGTGTNVLDVIKSAFESLADVFGQYLDFKREERTVVPRVVKHVIRNNMNGISPNQFIINFLNEGQKNKPDVKAYIPVIKSSNPEIIKQIKEIPFEKILSDLSEYGLVISDKTWLNELYQSIIDSETET